jgi:hypothetical protein
VARLQWGDRWSSRWAALLLTGLALVLPVSADIQKVGGGKKGTSLIPGAGDPETEADKSLQRALQVPSAKSAHYRALRGQAVTITLVAVAAGPADVQFLLGEMPRAGSLTEPVKVATARDRAVVTYVPALGGGLSEDSFTFRVRHQGTPTSASATVTIALTDPEVKLRMPERIEFGEVLVGQTAVRSLTVQNTGTGPWTGEVQVPTPWRLTADSTGPVTIAAAGGAATYRVVLEPKTPQTAMQQGTMTFPAAGKGADKVLLSAYAVAPFGLRPGYLSLQWDALKQRRHGSVTVFSRTNDLLSVSLKLPKPLKINHSELVIPAGGAQSVEVEVDEVAGMIEEALVVTSPGCEDRISIRAEPAPPHLKLEGVKEAREEMDVTKPTERTFVIDHTKPAQITVKNAGGSEGLLFCDLPPGFEVTGMVSGEPIAAGGAKTFEIAVKSAPGTLPAGRVVVKLSEDVLFVAVRGTTPAVAMLDPASQGAAHQMMDVTRVSKDSSDPDAGWEFASDEAASVAMFLGFDGVFPRGTIYDPSVPNVTTDLSTPVLKMPTASVTLKPPPAGFHYALFFERFRKNAEGLSVRCWDPAQNVNFDYGPRETTLTFSNLQYGAKIYMRLMLKNGDGKFGQPTPPFKLITPYESHWFKAVAWWSIAIALAGTLTFLWWRNRQLGG